MKTLINNINNKFTNMKTYNAIRSKWMRLASGLMAAMFLTLSFAGQASARILFEDDLYLNVQSEGIKLDSNNNVTVASAASIAIQDVTVTASATGSAGNSQTVTVVLADNSSGTCAVTGGTGTGVITVTCDDGTTSLDPGTTTDLQAAINPEALFVAAGGSGTLAATGGPTSLANGTDDGDINLQFGNDGTDATMKYNVGTQDITLDTPGNDINFSNDTLTTTGEIRFENSSHTRIREEAFAAYSGVTAPQCNYVNEVALDTTTKAVYVCTATGAPGGTWKSADNNPAPGTSAGNTLYWNGTAWAESSALTNSGGVVTVSNGTTFTANGNVNIGDNGDTVTISSTTWDITGPGVASGFTGITSTGAINFSGASSLSLASVAGPANPVACTEGDLVYNQSTNLTYICTVTGNPGTWTALAAGTQDFEAVYAADGNKTLSITDNLPLGFAINEGANNYFKIVTTDASEALNINDNNGAATTNIGTGSSTGTVNVGTGATAQTLHFGDGLGVKTVSLGSTNTTSATTIASGSTAGILNVNASNGTAVTNIGTGSTSGTVTIGGGSDDVTVNGKVVGITSVGVGNDVTLTAADDIIFDDAQLTGIVQMSDADTDWAATFSTDGIVDNINSFTLTSSGNGASNVGVYDSGANLENINPTGVVTDLQNALETINGLIGAAAPNVEDLTFYPEFPDSVVYPDGGSNKGTLESFHENASNMNYYNWTSTNAALQDMNLRFQFPLPADFKTTGNFTFRYRTGTAVNTDNKVDIVLYNITDASSCGSSLANVNAGAWATGTITSATILGACAGISAGDIVRVDVIFYDNSGAADYADVGWVKWVYTN